MTVDSVDQRLLAWAERLHRIDANLLALEAEPAYQLLAGPERAALEGLTAERVAPAMGALTELLAHRARLSAVLERAKEVRGSMSSLPFWEKNERLAQIDGLLDRGAGPPAERERLIPEELLAAMVRAFELAHDAIMAVAHAWVALDLNLERRERDVAELWRSAPDLARAPATRAEFESLEGDLIAFRARVARDPLGIRTAIDETLGPKIATLRLLIAQRPTAT